jgi:hypothetical protein
VSWRAWHIFIADRAISERFLVECVGPEMTALSAAGDMSSWFFIRYWENGPHIRLRVKDIGDEAFEQLGERLRARAASAVAASLETAGQYAGSMRFDGWHADPSALPWFDQGTVVEIMYEPEYRRYGGVRGLETSESLFNVASRAALKIVGSTLDAWPKRETLALHQTAAAICTVAHGRAEIVDYLAKMATAWRGFAADAGALETAARETYDRSPGAFRQIVVRMIEGDPGGADWPPSAAMFGGVLAKGRDHLVRLAREKLLVSPLTGIAPRSDEELASALKSIMMSQVHMNNNRLGVTPGHEYQFAQMLLWASADLPE